MLSSETERLNNIIKRNLDENNSLKDKVFKLEQQIYNCDSLQFDINQLEKSIQERDT